MGCFARGRHIPDPVFESMTLALDSANHHPRQNQVWPSDTELANSAMFEVIVTRWKRIRRTRLVTASPHEDNFSAAIERLDRALNRLDTSVRAMAGRVRSVNKLEGDAQRLTADRSRLASDLDRATARADRLEETAGEVSRRLVDAMETVKTVLEHDEQNRNTA